MRTPPNKTGAENAHLSSVEELLLAALPSCRCRLVLNPRRDIRKIGEEGYFYFRMREEQLKPSDRAKSMLLGAIPSRSPCGGDIRNRVQVSRKTLIRCMTIYHT